jgi:prepilin-type N-terminal cleavage/methylation domain-containing protein
MITKSEKQNRKHFFLSEDSMLRNTKGFTLIELMVVILIIGILAALAIPKFTDASTKAKFAEIPTVMSSYDHAQLAYLAETGNLTTAANLVFDAPAGSKWFAYDDNGEGNYTATSSVAVGPIAASTLVATTSVATNSNVTHNVSATAARKYLVNF